jgi:hypothetical protein
VVSSQHGSHLQHNREPPPPVIRTQTHLKGEVQFNQQRTSLTDKDARFDPNPSNTYFFCLPMHQCGTAIMPKHKLGHQETQYGSKPSVLTPFPVATVIPLLPKLVSTATLLGPFSLATLIPVLPKLVIKATLPQPRYLRPHCFAKPQVKKARPTLPPDVFSWLPSPM